VFLLLPLGDAAPAARPAARAPRTGPLPSALPVAKGKRRSTGGAVLRKAEAKRLHALARARERRETGLFLVEGVRGAEDLLASSIVPRVAVISPSLEDTPRGRVLAERLRAAMRTELVSEHELQGIADAETPQGVVVAAEIPRRELSDIAPAATCMLTVLDAVQDPGNFGTIVRSADAFGAAAVVTLPGTVDPWNPKAVRSAAGSSLRVPIVDTTIDALVPFLRNHGFLFIGADVGGADISTLAPEPSIALVLGNEGAGLSEATRASLDGAVSVPILGHAESLNVGVAAGILMYMLSRSTAGDP
jgi:RNA methyltransferase, TrmH family